MESTRNYNLNRVLDDKTEEFEAKLDKLREEYSAYMETETFQKESGLSTGQEILVAKACEHIWSGIAHDIPLNSVTAKEMIEETTGRLEMHDYKQEREFFELVLKNLGIVEAIARIADRCAFDRYEAGGSQTL